MGNLVRTPHSEVNTTLEVLDRLGITSDHLARLRAEPDYAKRVAEFMLRGGLEGSVPHKLAKALMGKNFFGVEEWATIFNVQFTKKQLRQIAEFPWGEDVLNAPCPFVKGKTVKETHFAFLGLEQVMGKSLSILGWQDLCPPTGQLKFYSYAPQAWYSTQPFAKRTCKFRWYLMLTNIVPNSESQTYEEQLPMVPADYEVPTAVEDVSKHLLVVKKTGSLPNQTRWGRVNDLTIKVGDITTDGHRVVVGGYCGGGLNVYYGLGGYRVSYIGLSVSRKVPSRTL